MLNFGNFVKVKIIEKQRWKLNDVPPEEMNCNIWRLSISLPIEAWYSDHKRVDKWNKIGVKLQWHLGGVGRKTSLAIPAWTTNFTGTKSYLSNSGRMWNWTFTLLWHQKPNQIFKVITKKKIKLRAYIPKRLVSYRK